METIIKKAIEGGWLPLSYETVEYHNGGISFSTGSVDYETDAENYLSHKEIVCDPLFWQALGKACGWSDDGVTVVWLYHAHEFYNLNLTEGWEKAISYLQEITNLK